MPRHITPSERAGNVAYGLHKGHGTKKIAQVAKPSERKGVSRTTAAPVGVGGKCAVPGKRGSALSWVRSEPSGGGGASGWADRCAHRLLIPRLALAARLYTPLMM
jgi:hypothetical protein